MHEVPKFSDKEEIARFISENNIKILNLCHIPEDGKLKTLSFAPSEKNRIEGVLELGERADGSSLFSFIAPGKSDIYIKPDFRRVFINPFSSVPTLNILCDYLDEDGKRLEIAPKNVLARAEAKLHASSQVVLKALAELEFYIISKQEKEVSFAGLPDKNYHESRPFAMFEDLRNEVLVTLAEVGITTKYGHGEVGRIFDNDNTLIEQHEVELTPQNLGDAADEIAVAKWVIRNVCVKYGVSVSFSPKITMEHAGTGMHVHLCGLSNGKNILSDNGTLSSEAKEMIGGILKFAPSLSAFGNPTPVSYLRLIARKESPMHICWSARNRLALIRVPLWWTFKTKNEERDNCRETFEYRASDAFANAYLLFAAITLAVSYGLDNSAESLKIAEDLHSGAKSREDKFRTLPRSCVESARCLQKERRFYEADAVFPKVLIDEIVDRLTGFGDKDLWKNSRESSKKSEDMLKHYLHYG